MGAKKEAGVKEGDIVEGKFNPKNKAVDFTRVQQNVSLGSEKLAKKLKTKIIKHAGLVFDANPLRMRLPVMENLKEVTR